MRPAAWATASTDTASIPWSAKSSAAAASSRARVSAFRSPCVLAIHPVRWSSPAERTYIYRKRYATRAGLGAAPSGRAPGATPTVIRSTDRPDLQGSIMATHDTTRDSLYIDGDWVPSTGTGTIDVIDSTTEEVLGTVPEGTTEDVDRAVAAAKAAFPAWSALSVAERTGYLTTVAEGLGTHMDSLADLITHEVGMPRMLSQLVQVGLPMNSFATAAQVAADFTWEQELGNSLVVREPIGVVGCITPWNYPLHQIAAKVAPALAAGCTVVVKPSEVAPLNAFVLADVMAEAGCRPVCSTWSPGSDPSSGRPSPPMATSTWCRSPAPPVPAGASPKWLPPRSSGWRSSSAASRRT